MITAVVFDIGETLIDDTREWGVWAEWLGVPAHTLSALVGAVTVLGRDNAEALRLVRPGLDVAVERAAREAAGRGERITETDLYPDVRPALAALRARGLWVGAAGNQTVCAGESLHALGLPLDAIAMSEGWAVAKLDPGFYARVSTWAQRPADQILYVGDHRDNDVLGAHAVGLRTALIRRGPWGYLWSDEPQSITAADWRIDHLTELPDLIAVGA